MTAVKISADTIYTNAGTPLQHHVIILNDKNQIVQIDPVEMHDSQGILRLRGVIVPGYVNTHCHLELSHMMDKIDTGTGLLAFINAVVSQRNVSADIIQEKISAADQEMFQNGIVAVGDISNTEDTFECKRISKIHYHTFVEMFDLMCHQLTDSTFHQYKQVYDLAPWDDLNSKSSVPHAPYSVSPTLFSKLNQLNQTPTSVSVHTLETQAEIDLFTEHQGALPTLFREMGVEMNAIPEAINHPLDYLLTHLDPKHRTLFVHNTLAQRSDINRAHAWGGKQVYWASCPNANLYIENRLPNYQTFMNEGAKICLGTDSLSSNWQLSIFEEMRTVAKYHSGIPVEELVKWSSLHGAEALGLDHLYGSIEVGKTPGLNLIEVNADGKIDRHSTSRKII